jgi:uncharacterized membrane protein
MDNVPIATNLAMIDLNNIVHCIICSANSGLFWTRLISTFFFPIFEQCVCFLGALAGQ